VEAVVVARVDVPVTTKVLVVVEFVAARLVMLAVVKAPSVAKRLEDDALVTIDEEAKRFCVKVLRKRRALVPRV
jgi:hypothetical protein